MNDNRLEVLYKSFSNKAEVTKDIEFPSINTTSFPASDLEHFARTVTFTGGSEFLLHTKSMGRSAFVPLTFKLEGNNFNCIFIKGVGKYKEFELFKTETPSPFTYDQRFIRMEGEIIGSSSKNDQSLDALNSIKLKEMGIKTRLPLAGYYLEKIETYEGEKSVRELISEGKINERVRPYLSIWAMETPYRLSDLTDTIHQGSITEINQFLVTALRYTRGIKGLEALENYLADGDLNDTDKLLSLWSEAILKGLEDTFLKMKSNGVTHNYLHVQNLSLHMEFCDNSTVLIKNSKDESEIFNLKADWRVLIDEIFKLHRNYKEKFPESEIDPEIYENKIRTIRKKVFGDTI